MLTRTLIIHLHTHSFLFEVVYHYNSGIRTQYLKVWIQEFALHTLEWGWGCGWGAGVCLHTKLGVVWSITRKPVGSTEVRQGQMKKLVGSAVPGSYPVGLDSAPVWSPHVSDSLQHPVDVGTFLRVAHHDGAQECLKLRRVTVK